MHKDPPTLAELQRMVECARELASCEARDHILRFVRAKLVEKGVPYSEYRTASIPPCLQELSFQMPVGRVEG